MIHQALEILDALTRGGGLAQSTFTGPENLPALLKAGFGSGPAVPMIAEGWATICGK